METITISGSTEYSTNYNWSPEQIPAYWRAIEFLSSNLASFPISVQQDGTARDVVHPLEKLFGRKANSQQTAKRVLKCWTYHGENYGNGYLYIQRDPVSFVPIGFYNLFPSDVTPYRLIPANGSLFDVEVWYHHGPSKTAFPAADILHYAPQISYDGLVGYDPRLMFNRTFERAQMLESYQTKFLRKGSMIRGSVEFPAGTSKEQAEEIMARAKEFRASTGDRDLIALFGGAKLTNTTISPVDAQLDIQDQAITKKVAQITGVPQQFLLDMAESKYNAATVEAYGADVVRFCFRPRLDLLEAEMSTKCLSEDEQDQGLSLHFDTSALLRGDSAVEMTVAAQGVAGGLQTRNEGRQEIGLAPVDDPAADKLLVPTAVATIAPDSTAQAESETHSADTAQDDHYDALRPLLGDASDRVERKTLKALETAETKPEAQRIAYTNVLAEQQRTYCRDALLPVAQVVAKLGGKVLDVDAIAETYAQEVRRRAGGGEAKSLIDIVEDYRGS